MARSHEIVDYWLALDKKKYYKKDLSFDAELRDKFSDDIEKALLGDYDDWCDEPHGSLAVVLLLDQMTRNVFRDTVDMFKGDSKALAVTNAALSSKHDEAIGEKYTNKASGWYYMPFMHSEDVTDQQRCVGLCTLRKLDDNMPWAIEHAEIIQRFGRFPHRNSLLGRSSTEEEIKFLEDGGFAG